MLIRTTKSGATESFFVQRRAAVSSYKYRLTGADYLGSVFSGVTISSAVKEPTVPSAGGFSPEAWENLISGDGLRDLVLWLVLFFFVVCCVFPALLCGCCCGTGGPRKSAQSVEILNLQAVHVGIGIPGAPA